MASTLLLRRAGFIAVAAVSVFALSACAPSKGPASDYSGLPTVDEHVAEGVGDDEGEGAEEEVVEGETSFTWLQQGGRFAVTTWGSSTCPVVGERVSVVHPQGEGNTIEIAVSEIADDAVCTMDLVPHTTEFWTPLHVTPTEELTVVVGDEEIEVPVF
ncbi:hypothetical protein [Agromyces seonyuensis]|uniref:Lipoprotein n=1 Tax=Agromyces seonyuensis TaxID=2662446 RepID=A0A6I4P678_9MICO|nr:hypothetical protein [Agromyces seonyuensis]MWB99084.1 hypothetical protein [Agromyces seonyuensis]